jgi:hypothetical protein
MGAPASQTGCSSIRDQAPTGLDHSASPPRAEIERVVECIDPAAFEPTIKRFTDDIYERLLSSCEDYLRDNLNWNIASHISMLERENQRMRTELFEVDRALGCMSLGHETRIQTLNEQTERHNRAVNELWKLREELAKARGEAA